MPDGGNPWYQGRGELVPIEFLGLARRLRERVLATDTVMQGAVEAIVSPLARNLRRNPRLPSVVADQVVKDWVEWVPTEFCLDREVPVKDSHWWRGRPRPDVSLKITELRVTASHTSRTAWEDAKEPGITLARVELLVPGADGRRLTLDTRPLGTVSLHALARRYQRGGCDEAAIMRDLHDILRVGVTQGDDVRCGSGIWVGKCVAAHDVHATRVVRVRHVRSYLDEQMVPAVPWVPLERRVAERPVAD